MSFSEQEVLSHQSMQSRKSMNSNSLIYDPTSLVFELAFILLIPKIQSLSYYVSSL